MLPLLLCTSVRLSTTVATLMAFLTDLRRLQVSLPRTQESLPKCCLDARVQVTSNDRLESLACGYEEEGETQGIRDALLSKLRSPSMSVEVRRSTSTDPLYSIKTFEELRLPESLLLGLYDLNFRSPSRIQETALPILLANP